ncbi:hypothetical protein HDU79_000368, partial [Rhizoclosmatium sp. JEL0117]
MTDGDLKQRREIQNGTAFYTDQASVRAAIHGRILILDGIEKAERNVLPIINNLLENREMALDDGRFLVHPKRFDSLTNTQSKAELDKWKLVRTSEKFVVIALGLPVPKYDGHPLDPPLRSRFQARNVNNPTFFTQISRLVKIAPNVPQKILERLVSVGMVLRSESATSAQSGTSSVIIPEFPGSLENVAKLMNLVNGVNPRSLLDSVYPHYLMGVLESEQKLIIESAYQRFEFMQLSPSSSTWWFDSFFRLGGILPSTVAKTATVSLLPVKETLSLKPTEIVVKSGTLLSSDPEFYVQTDYHKSLLTSLVLAHAVSDICVIGPKGVGKSALLRALIKLLGYQAEYIPLFKDMSARDLLQRRSTNLKGDTVWENSALVKAAVEGSIAILDQIEVASEGVIASIQSLIGEREVSLPDGSLLVSSEKFSTLSSVLSSSELASRKVIKVHDSFRIVALARPTLQSGGGKNWLTPELMNLFMFIPMRALTYAEEREVIMSICPGVEDSVLTQLLGFANKLRTEHNESLKSLAEGLSTRQLLRCVRHLSLYPDDSLYDIIMKAQLAPFLPTFTREALERLLKDSKIMQSVNVMGSVDFGYKIEKQNGVDTLIIGNVSHPVSVNSNKLLIPDIVFYDNPKQTAILHEMLKDYILGEHLLLIGNQGVGKNKLVDKFLQLLQLPREYIQLHRDTTIHSLTSTPTIINGVLVYEDSPLVRACREGYILVVDEADKAPTHVTSVLKSLVEDGEMVLSDGRRLVYNAPKELENVIVVHNNFRDVFAAHCIGNPDKHSELQLIKKYAPSVDDDILAKLVDAFNDLRVLVNEGLINYPYSTREIVSVVRHLESYPFEGLSRALSNVFDFDSYDSDVKELIIATLSKNGIHVGMQSDFKVELGNVSNLPGSVELERWNRSSGKGTGATECYSQSLQLQLLGGWPLKFHQPSAESDKSSMSKLSVLRRIDSRAVVSMIELANGNLLTVDLTGMARVWQTEGTDISIEMNEWKRLVGALEVSNLSILYSGEKENYPDAAEEIYSESKKIEDQLQGQKGDDSGGAGSGGQGVSGSGGSGGDGEGGSGGSGSGGEQAAEGRQSGTVDLSSFSLRTANDVPKEVTDAQKQMHEIAMQKRLEQLKMTEKDMQSFAFYRQHITREIRELRAIIEATEAKNKERVWLRNQSTGDVDDTKLVEGVTGERAIYKRRGEDTSVFQQKPKKLHISFDLSASMTRFNGLDSRLDRSLECALLIMEAFKSFEHKFRYKLSGHSGDGPNISFIEEHKYPKDEKDMFGVLGKMSTHAKFCLSGDNTVAAVDSVINDVVKDEADDYFALVLSDANITQYNIHPEYHIAALSQNDKVNAYIIFIGSIKDQAD